ncbi:MAG: hypothetical protein IKU17_04280, partial [Clostridia bacterium]|nr:hypothetical protein [Clostridia bacterium]
MKKAGKIFLRVLGYIIAFFGGVLTFSSFITIGVMLWGTDMEWVERIFSAFLALLLTLGSGVVLCGVKFPDMTADELYENLENKGYML